MDKLLVPLLVGLIAGAGGVFLGKSMSGSATARAHGGDTLALEARIASLEEALANQQSPAALLEGDARPASTRAPGSEPLAVRKLSADQLAALVEQLQPSMREAAKQELDERITEKGGIDALIDEEVNKKSITLDELALELDLTRDQEVELRELVRASTEEFLKVLAAEGESVDDVRRDFEEAKGNPEKQAEVASKYVGRLMTNLGPVMSAAMKYETGVTKILGAEKKAKMEKNYDVTDLDPLGIESVFESAFGD